MTQIWAPAPIDYTDLNLAHIKQGELDEFIYLFSLCHYVAEIIQISSKSNII